MTTLEDMFAIWWVDLLFITSAILFNLLIAGLCMANKSLSRLDMVTQW